MTSDAGEPRRKTCFVVMGFKKKPDYATGRTLDLDKTYRTIIKPAVEAAGLKCIRADEIVHSGVIDVPMYQQLHDADLVLADISTLNPNALYELGVRHALRPHWTIVIGESQLAYPFDVNHTVIRRYEHKGDVIDYEETVRFRGELEEAIRTIVSTPVPDSPVYVHLNGLREPTIVETQPEAPAVAAEPSRTLEPSLGALVEQAEMAMGRSDFAAARSLFEAAHLLRPTDHYLTQRLALSTYKSKAPTVTEALMSARGTLASLAPETSTDPETLGLWGAVHKRLWEVTGERGHLDASVFAYEKGFYLKNDYYDGINLAFLLSIRAAQEEPAEAIADFVAARRVRLRVAEICRGLLAALESRAESGRLLREGRHRISTTALGVAIDPNRLNEQTEQRYWIEATLAEAHAGVGQDEECQRALERAFALPVPGWMRETTKEQLAKLRELLAESPLRHLEPTAAATQAGLSGVPRTT